MGILQSNMKIGILGGGQLAMMMIQMSTKHNIDFIVIDPNENPPASKYAKCIKSTFNDKSSLDVLIKECDVVTIDFENVPSESLRYLEEHVTVYPSPHAVEICQDRLKEKLIFNRNNIPTTEYKVIDKESDLTEAIEELGLDTILKSRKLGYDGKNQISINNLATTDVWEKSGKVEAILERKIHFKTELSIIGVCTKSGDTFFYPLVENFHRNGILDTSIAPYNNKKLQKKAEAYHRKISKQLNYVGVLVIEFFLDHNGILIANEMAPRVHNSGHWTNEGANISQFEAHILAISDIDFAKLSMKGNSAMLNILSKMPDKKLIEQSNNYQIYDYGKTERKNRKLGHITCIDNDRDVLEEKINTLKNIIF